MSTNPSAKPNAPADDLVQISGSGDGVFRLAPLSMSGFAILAVVVIILDQATKSWVRASVGPSDVIVVIPNFFNIIHRGNTGAAFSFFHQHPEYLAIFAFLVACALLTWSWLMKPEERPLRWPLSMVFGGAVGNLIDRFRIGHVTDMIDWHWKDAYHFATFNIADSAICVGMGILIFLNLFPIKPAESEKAPS